MDAVLLLDQKDPTRLYQQAKAVEAQRALLDLKGMTEGEDDEVLAQVKKSLAQIHALVGLLLCSRLTVRKPVPRPQEELPLEAGITAGGNS